MTDFLAVVLAFIGFDCFVALAISRYKHRNGYYNSRLMFVDIVLAIAAFEIVADRLAHLHTLGPSWVGVWQAMSAICQGALVAAGIALVMSYRRGAL